MRITLVSLRAGDTDEIWVELELNEGENTSKQSFLIPTEVYTRLGLCRGECSCEAYDAVEREAAVYAAYKRGLYILGFGACSQRMLVSKLRAKGFEGEAAKSAVERICAAGFLNEYEGAKREAENCVAKLWGVSRIKARLAEKRYSADAIEAALFALEDSGVDFDDNCKRCMDKKYPRLPLERDELQKMISALCRQGYTVGQIKKAYAALCQEHKLRRIYEY